MGGNLRFMSLMTVILPSFPWTTMPPAHKARLTSSTIMHTTHKHCLIAAKRKHVYRPIRGRPIKSTPLSYASRSSSDIYVTSVIMTAVFSVVLRVRPDPLRDPFNLPTTGYQGQRNRTVKLATHRHPVPSFSLRGAAFLLYHTSSLGSPWEYG